MKLTIIRPEIASDKRDDLVLYLGEQWRRAREARRTQVDDDYARWSKAYNGVPLEKERTVPFYKASNFVVKLIRIFLDTHLARSLNVMFDTRPFIVVDGLPREVREGWEFYLNKKAIFEWDYYQLARNFIHAGNKNGTAIIKQPWVTREAIEVTSPDGTNQKDRVLTLYEGPTPEVVPFEDFYLYPITAQKLCDARVLMHRLRFTAEEARENIEAKRWKVPEGMQTEGFLSMPKDVKRNEEMSDAGVYDNYLRECQPIEMHLRWAITNDKTKKYDIVALYHPETRLLLDLYYNPYPRNLCVFDDYRPFPRESIFFGESMCQILGQSQEEASRIHNERRDNSLIASSVTFKRRNGSLIPNPSTNWYPGKVWDLESMDDLEIMEIGRNYENLIEQEDYVFKLAQLLSGINDVMQGQATGSQGKGGVYNTMGTIAMMQESNQRQDTNMKDARLALSGVSHKSSVLQAKFGADDPFINTLPTEVQAQVKEAFRVYAGDSARYITHEVKESDAGVNKEVERMNLIQTAQILGQYGQTVQQMAQQLVANPQMNPALRAIMQKTVDMQRWMAIRLLRQFDEYEAEELLPDVNQEIADAAAQSGGSGGPGGPAQGGPGQLGPGGPGGPAGPVSRPQLQALATMPQAGAGANAA